MGRPRGIQASTVTLPLSDGDWISIKDRLTIGEERDITGKAIKGYSDGGKRVELDAEKLSFLTAATYIVAWSFVGVDGRPMLWPANGALPQKVDILRTLDGETMREIDAALEQHRAAQQAVTEKNGSGIGTGSDPVSSSVEPFTGASTTSAH